MIPQVILLLLLYYYYYHVLCGQKRALKSDKIEALNADGKPLE